MRRAAVLAAGVMLIGLCFMGRGAADPPDALRSLKEINPPRAAIANRSLAIVGATLIDGRGGPSVLNSVVLVRGDKIVNVGTRDSTPHPLARKYLMRRD